MLIPQFSLRRLLGVMAALAVVSLIASFGVRGHSWALAATGALAATALAFLAYFLAWLFAAGASGCIYLLKLRQPTPESPFATHKPAPQVLEPRETES